MFPALLLSDLPAHPAVAKTAPLIAQAAKSTPNAPVKAGSFPYASLQVGVGFPKNYEGDFDLEGLGNIDTSLDLNTGFNGELAVGYKINDFRTDVSVGYGNYPVHQQSYSTPGFGRASVSGKGAAQLTTVMLNGYYDVPIRNADNTLSRWSPYLGAGIGYANISTPACAASDCYEGGSAGAFAWQAKAGVSYRATERGFAFLEGGYVGTAGNTSVDDVTFGSFGAWRINLGWRQGFGGAPSGSKTVQAQAEPAAAPAMAPEPTPAPAPAVEQSVPIRGLW